MSNDSRPLHLAVALDGTGWHPASWREPDARPTDLLSARYWTDLIVQAERGLLDFVTIEDALTPQYDDPSHADDRVDRVRGRLDAVLIASRVAPLTRHIGLVPTAVVTHTEPFHLSKAIATLDYVSSGRAGIRVQVSREPRGGRATSAAATWHPGCSGGRRCSTRRRTTSRCCAGSGTAGRTTPRSATWRRAVSSTGHKLHYIDFEGARFSVRGPSITPRPPQGQPIVAALGHGDPALRASSRRAPTSDSSHRTTPPRSPRSSTPSRRERDAGLPPVRVFADLVVFLDGQCGRGPGATASARRARRRRITSDAEIFVGTSGAARRPARRSGTRRARRDSACVRPPCPMTSPADHRRAGAGAAASRSVP